MSEVPGLDVQPRHLQMVLAILHQHLPQHRVWAFGSRVQGRAGLHSDLDLAVEGATALTLSQRAEVLDAFSESDLPWKVDVVDLLSVEPEFRALVEAQRVPLLPEALQNLPAA